MCLAIAPNSRPVNNPLARYWSRIASTPLKLLSFGALFHLLIGAGIIIYSRHTGTHVNANALITAVTYGVLPLFVFGFLLDWLPRKYSLAAVHYGRYNSVYLLLMAALLLLELASISGDHWLLAGMLLLVPGWIIALQGLWHMHGWIRTNVQVFSKSLVVLLLLNLVLLLLSTLEQNTDVLTFDAIPLISVSVIWPGIIILSALLILKAPARSRVISC